MYLNSVKFHNSIQREKVFNINEPFQFVTISNLNALNGFYFFDFTVPKLIRKHNLKNEGGNFNKIKTFNDFVFILCIVHYKSSQFVTNNVDVFVGGRVLLFVKKPK